MDTLLRWGRFDITTPPVNTYDASMLQSTGGQLAASYISELEILRR
jgi:hypothetical protein